MSAEPIHHIDLFPTLAQLAGTKRPDVVIDGVSLAPHWTRKATMVKRSLMWHFPCYLQGKSDRFKKWRTIPGGSLLIDGRWKLVHFFGGRDDGAAWLELYDLAGDPREEFDRSKKYPEKSSTMMRELVTWRKTTKAAVPTSR